MATIGNTSPDAGFEGVDVSLEPQTQVSKATMVKQAAPFACPISICMFGTCLFWIPLVFWLAAANVLPTCEMDLELFMKVYGLYCLVSPAFFVTLIYGVAVMQKRLFYLCQVIVALVGCCGTTGLVIWGLIIWSSTTDDKCYNGEAELDHHINPRTLCAVFVFMGLLGIGQNFVQACSAVKKYAAREVS